MILEQKQKLKLQTLVQICAITYECNLLFE